MLDNKVVGSDKILYTTGRLTSEMVIKTVQMGIPVLTSRSGFTAWGVELARQVNLTLIGRARGKRFIVLAGEERIVFDADPGTIDDEAVLIARKGDEGCATSWRRRRVASSQQRAPLSPQPPRVRSAHTSPYPAAAAYALDTLRPAADSPLHSYLARLRPNSLY